MSRLTLAFVFVAIVAVTAIATTSRADAGGPSRSGGATTIVANPAPGDPGDVEEAAQALLDSIDPETLRDPKVAKQAEVLRKLIAVPARGGDQGRGRAIHEAMDRLGEFVAPTYKASEEFGIRVEEELGTPRCPEEDIEDDEAHCADVEWLSTRSQNFVNIKGLAYLRGTSEIPQGVQMTASFVASRDDTNVAITFSGEAYVEDDVPGLNRRMFVQALVDGKPVDPTDVVFAVTEHVGARAFVFTTNVDAGIHTVEMRWRVDEDATAYLRDASLHVRMGRDIASNYGNLVVKTPESGLNEQTTVAAWTDVPDMGDWVYVGNHGNLTATFSAETAVSNGKRIALRALVGGVAMSPSNVIFAKGASPQSRSMTFGAEHVSPGWHYVEFQWQVEAGGVATLGDRSLALASFPGDTHPFVSPPSGSQIYTATNGLEPMPGMTADIVIPAKGNGEVAVIFSAELGTTGGSAYALLAVDGALQTQSLVELTDGTTGAQVKSWVFEAKGLAPGAHELEIWWAGPDAYVGDRTLAVMSEVGFVPDLAEAPRFNGGHIGMESDYIGGIEPLIGSRKVLAILIDPGFCPDGLGTITTDPDCYDGDSVPKAKVEAALFGHGGQQGGLVTFEPNNVASYFSAMSGGRFTITKAGPGVVGWYDTDFHAGHYYDHLGACQGGYDQGGHELHAEAVKHADASIDFSQFDTNNDGELDTNELAIVVVIPRPNGDGSQIQPLYGSTCPGNAQWLELDGVTMPKRIAKWNTSLDNAQEPYQFATAAHEIMHLVAGLDDLYLGADASTYPRSMDLMSSGRWTSTHIGPFSKLMLGWVTPIILDEDGTYVSKAVAMSDTVHILPRYNNPWAEEFYIIENRQEGLGSQYFDEDIPDSGIGVWHIVTDPVANQNAPIGTTQADWDDSHIPSDKPSSKGQMGRNGIRLLRPFDDIEDGTAVFASKDQTQWDSSEYDLESGACFQIVPLGDPFRNKLAWADCVASGYNLEFLSASGVNMTFRLEID